MSDIEKQTDGQPEDMVKSELSLPRSMHFAVEYCAREAGMSPSDWIAQCIRESAKEFVEAKQKEKDEWELTPHEAIGHLMMNVGALTIGQNHDIVIQIYQNIEEKILENRERMTGLTEGLAESRAVFMEDGTEHELPTDRFTRRDIECLKTLVSDASVFELHFEEMPPVLIKTFRELDQRRIG